MSKVQVFLSKALKVNLGQDEHGQQINLDLPYGLQEVDPEVAEHWFVQAHAQEIPQSAIANQELQAEFEQLQADHTALQAQSDATTKKITELEKQAKADAKTIAELNKQIADAAAPEKAK